MFCILYKRETDFFDRAMAEEVYIEGSKNRDVHLEEF